MKQNPYNGYATEIGASIGNLMKGLLAPQGNRYQNDLYRARTAQAQAAADKSRAEIAADAAKVARVNAARDQMNQGIAALFGPRGMASPEQAAAGRYQTRIGSDQNKMLAEQDADFLPEVQMTQQQHENKYKPEIMRGYLASDGKAADLGSVMRAIIANYGDRSLPALEGAWVGSGKDFQAGASPNALTVERQDELQQGLFDQETSINDADNRQSGLNNAADNARAIATNEADNVRALEQTNLDNAARGERNDADNKAAGERNDASIAGMMERATLNDAGKTTREGMKEAGKNARADTKYAAQMEQLLVKEGGLNLRQANDIENKIDMLMVQEEGKNYRSEAKLMAAYENLLVKEAGMDARAASQIAGRMAVARLQAENRLAVAGVKAQPKPESVLDQTRRLEAIQSGLLNSGMMSGVPEDQLPPNWSQMIANADAAVQGGKSIPQAIAEAIAGSGYEWSEDRPGASITNLFSSDAGWVKRTTEPNPGATGGGTGEQNGGPAVGTIEDGMKFLGGNPADPKSWEPI